MGRRSQPSDAAMCAAVIAGRRRLLMEIPIEMVLSTLHPYVARLSPTRTSGRFLRLAVLGISRDKDTGKHSPLPSRPGLALRGLEHELLDLGAHALKFLLV